MERRICPRFLTRGFVVGRRPGVSVLHLDPALTTENGDIEAFLRAFEETLLAG
jgi:4-aminobutyrate aminotransferase-like enzyme